MSRRRRQRQSERKVVVAPPDVSRDRLRPWLLGGMTALFVAQPLFAVDSPGSEGDGLPLVMLWIALFVFWMLGAIGRPSLRVRLGWTDAAVLLLVAWHTLAAVVATVRGSPRPAVNALWEWIGLGLAFFLARQFIVGRRETRAVLVVMIALAVGLSGYGLYQQFYSLSRDRAAYERNPDDMLRANGLWYAKDSPQRQLFAERLRTSGPLATFALQNSLAGFLAPWLVVLAGAAIAGMSRKPLDRWGGSCTATPNAAHEGGAVQLPPQRIFGRLVRIACCALPIAACLLLTKSRSGCVAAVLGLVLAWMWCRERRVRIGWKIPAAAAAVLAVSLVAGAAVGWVNRDAFGRAEKSFGYRLQYWRSTVEMIADHPWLGCGPGNFQNEYTRYKLPEASEEVADPHNFLLEVWGTAGTPAALALMAALGGFFWLPMRNRREGRRGRREGDGDNSSPTEGDRGSAETVLAHESRRSTAETTVARSPFAPPQADAPAFVVAGAATVGGILVAWPLVARLLVDPNRATSPYAMEDYWFGFIAIGLSSTVVAIWLLSGWIREGHMPRALPTLGAIVLLVDLLAAGGIGFAGVAGTLWLLLAVGLNAAESVGRTGTGRGPAPHRTADPAVFRDGIQLPRSAAFAGLVLAITLAATCYVSAYDPVLRARGLMPAAERKLAAHRPGEAEKYFEAAAQADPLAAEPWRRLAGLTLDAWDRSDAAFDRLERYNAGLERRSVNSSVTWSAVGDSYRTVFGKPSPRWRADRRAEIIARAVDAYARAVELYPNSPLCRANLALACRDAGDDARCREEARIALELDDITPHDDKKLHGLRDELTKLLEE